MQMNRSMLWITGAFLAALLVPTKALAFALTADRTTIFVGESVQLTLSGSATDVTQFFVGVTPDASSPSPFTYFSSATAAAAFVGSVTGTPPLAFVEVLPGEVPPIFLVLSSEFDPDTFEPLPFSVVDGAILEVTLTGIAPTSPTTDVTFEICTQLDCIFDPNSNLRTILSIDITILQRDGNPVPEPATLWLALAALVAGGAVFRNGSKRS
jgi:hypothetical protein